MKKIFLFFFLFLYSSYLISQDNDWGPSEFSGLSNYVTKREGNIIFLLDSITENAERDSIIAKTHLYINQNLKLLNESKFNDTIFLILHQDRKGIEENLKMEKTVFVKGEDGAPMNIITCVYSKRVDNIKRGMMGMITKLKWGNLSDPDLEWLYNGLVTYSSSRVQNCDRYTFEEKYAYYYQAGKLLDKTALLQFPQINNSSQFNIACEQSAHIVEFLIDKFGVSKIKDLWIIGMNDFERIYGLKFEDILFTIAESLNKKYNNSIIIHKEKLYNDCIINSIFADWHSYYFLEDKPLNSKIEKNIQYLVPTSMNMETMNKVVNKTKEYISENLALINESEFNDSIRVVIVENKNQLEEILGFRMGGLFSYSEDETEKNSERNNTIYAVYNENHHSLKHELMHAITILKWGSIFSDDHMDWLIEGIATFADPNIYSCDGHNLEERNVFLLQTGNLLNPEELMTFPDLSEKTKVRIAYNQSAYIVKVLLKKYGVEKLKTLWQKGMNSFEEIYGLTFEMIFLNINSELSEISPNSITLDWEKFNKECIK